MAGGASKSSALPPAPAAGIEEAAAKSAVSPVVPVSPRARSPRVDARQVARVLARDPAGLQALGAHMGNRRMVRLLAREPIPASGAGRAGSMTAVPRVRIERDMNLPGRLVFRLGGAVVGTLDVSGAGRQLENVQLRDFTQTHSNIDVVDVEVRHPPGAKLSWTPSRSGMQQIKGKYGIGDIKLRLVELKPPYRRDSEIQLWPPLPYDLPAIDRPPPLSDEEYARRAEERRAWREESEKFAKALKRLHSRLDQSYAEYEDAQSGSAVEVVSELLGDARYPMPDEWNRVTRIVFDAEVAFDHSDHRGAERLMKKAELELADMNTRVVEFKRDRLNGAGRAIRILSAIAIMGEHAAHMIPGPLGTVLSLVYEGVKPPPRTLEEAAERIAGLAGIGHQASSPHIPGAPHQPATPDEPSTPFKPARPTSPANPPPRPVPSAESPPTARVPKPPQEPPAPATAEPPAPARTRDTRLPLRSSGVPTDETTVSTNPRARESGIDKGKGARPWYAKDPSTGRPSGSQPRAGRGKPSESGKAGTGGGARDPNVRPKPGLPSPAEDAVLQRYTEGLAKLREKREIYERMKQSATGAKELDRARAAYESAQRTLDQIETEALNAADSELAGHLDPLVKERRTLETSQGLYASTAGRRIPCDAVRLAPNNLRGMDFAEVWKAMGRPPDDWAVAPAPKGAGEPTARQRLWWEFADGSKLVVDLPRELGRVHKTADLPHAELHGPKGERLDQQGIEVPEGSTPAHMTITDHAKRLRDFFAERRPGP